MTAKTLLSVTLLLLFPGDGRAQVHWWKVQTSGIDTNLRGVSTVLNPRTALVGVVWASGSHGVIMQSHNQGKTWARLHVEGGASLDFRGIVAFSEKTAYVMSSGEGEKSRIYKTTDGGETWKLQYSDNRQEFFLDTIACVSEKECLALGDPINGKFLLLKTRDGEHWAPLPTDNMPNALPGEGAFAASNSCLALKGNEIFFATGGPAARVFHSNDRGLTWSVVETPVAHGSAASGIFSISLAEGNRIIVVGGDYKDPGRATEAAAYSADGGQTWKLSPQQPGGFRSSVSCFEDDMCLAVGPNGLDVDDGKDLGAYWKHADVLNLNAVVFLRPRIGWAVGPNGTIAQFDHRAITFAPFLTK